MHCLALLWDCLDKNAGQIQILLAILALILAGIAAWYAKKQIKIAYEQRAENNRLSDYRLRLEILSKAYECKELIYSIEHKFSKFKLLIDSHNERCTSSDFINQNELLPINELLINPKEVTTKIIKSVENSETKISNDDLAMYLSHLISNYGTLYTSDQGINRRIEDLERKLKI